MNGEYGYGCNLGGCQPPITSCQDQVMNLLYCEGINEAACKDDNPAYCVHVEGKSITTLFELLSSLATLIFWYDKPLLQRMM